MKSSEIRQSMQPGGRWDKIAYRASLGPAADLLCEIAAQLAEMNERERARDERAKNLEQESLPIK